MYTRDGYMSMRTTRGRQSKQSQADLREDLVDKRQPINTIRGSDVRAKSWVPASDQFVFSRPCKSEYIAMRV